MDTQDISLLNSGHDVGGALVGFPKELADFAALKAANDERADLVTAIAAKVAAQDTTTTDATTDKEKAREVLARTAESLSTRAQAYALSLGDLGLKQRLTLSYTDVRYGDATEDVNHVRELVRRVKALPAKALKDFRITPDLIKAAADAADAFEAADTAQDAAKATPRLATLALPDLLKRLGAVLTLLKALAKGQRNDPDPNFRWADLYTAFQNANKRRAVAPSRRLPTGQPRIVRTLPLTLHDDQPHRLANTNYGPKYTITVENRAAVPLRVWMAQKDGAPTTPGTCPAGAITTLTRADLGPATARYLTAAFDGPAGGQATVVVRRVA